MPYRSVNPYDGRLLTSFTEISDAELEQALSRAQTTYETWRRRPRSTPRPGNGARSGSINRVVSVVGEGSMAIRLVNEHLARDRQRA